MPFFTAVDARAEVKGSRDALGLVPLWSRLGRRFVGNLTTVSASARGFTTLLIGYHLAEQLGDDADQRPLDVFLRFEQVAAYTRLYRNGDSAFMGARRAGRTREATQKPPISAASELQILGDQKTYGLWGLYSTPARSSGLLRWGEPALTPAGRELVERLYLPALAGNGGRLERQLHALVRRDSTYFLSGQHSDLAAVLARLLAPRFKQAERGLYDDFFVKGGPDDQTRGDQARLAALLRALPRTEPFGIEPLHRIAGRAEQLPGHEQLARHLWDAAHLERVIVPWQAAFLYALSRDGQPLGVVASQLSGAWKALTYLDPQHIAGLRPEIEAVYGDAGAASRLVNVAAALAEGDYATVLRLALDHNQFIMRVRNGSEPWARLDGQTLNVRYHDETDAIPEHSQLPAMWRSTYFIDALKSVINEIDRP